MGATSLAFKVYLILGFELAVLYGCVFFIIQQCKKAFYANKTFLGIAFAEAVNKTGRRIFVSCKIKPPLVFLLAHIVRHHLNLDSHSFYHFFKLMDPIFFMTLSAIGYGSIIGFIIMDMDENDGMVGLKLATLSTAAMFIIVSVSGINFANPIFVSTISFLILSLIIWELIALVKAFQEVLLR